MQGTARAKFLRGSARKMRRVAALVRGLSVDHAAAMLLQIPNRAARPLAKVIHSARANALQDEGTSQHKPADFMVMEVIVDGGPIIRRIRPTSMGRAYRIRKRMCHLHVVVSDSDSLLAPTRRKRRAKAAGVDDKSRKGEAQQ